METVRAFAAVWPGSVELRLAVGDLDEFLKRLEGGR